MTATQLIRVETYCLVTNLVEFGNFLLYVAMIPFYWYRALLEFYRYRCRLQDLSPNWIWFLSLFSCWNSGYTLIYSFVAILTYLCCLLMRIVILIHNISNRVQVVQLIIMCSGMRTSLQLMGCSPLQIIFATRKFLESCFNF